MRKQGFEVIKGAVPPELCEHLRKEALSTVAQKSSLGARVLRSLCGLSGMFAATTRPIRSPGHRSHVALTSLEPGSAAERALQAAVVALKQPLADHFSGLQEQARLVELSYMVSFPGAEDQKAHTDVPPDCRVPIATLWVALQEVTRDMGPTMVHPCDPDDLAKQVDWGAAMVEADMRAAKERQAVIYSSDGEPEVTDHHPALPSRSPLPDSVEALELPPAVPLTMNVGDVALIDCGAFHFGSANTSESPRVQLSATFEGGVREALQRGGRDTTPTTTPSGFTYELHSSLTNRFRLSTFSHATRE